MTAETTRHDPPTRGDSEIGPGTADDIWALLSRGAVAGLVAGLAFIVASMYFADYSGKPTVAPFVAISTIFHGSAKPIMTPAALPAEVVTGVIVHLAFSISFGIGFAVVARAARRVVHNLPTLVAAALVYGTLLWVLNFEILGRTAFKFFSNPHGPNITFQGIIHPFIFGLFLVPFFVKPLRSKARS